MLSSRQNNGVNLSKSTRSCYSCLLSIILIVFLVSAIFSVGLGITYHFHKQLFIFIVNKEASLTKDSIATNVWKNLGPQNITLYYFNITNAHEVQHEGARPNIAEVGPFAFIKTPINDNLFWNNEETLLSYRRKISYEDNMPDSIDNPNNVKITTLNIPLVSLLNLIQNIENNPKYKQWKLVLKNIFKTADWINELLKYEPLFITKTVEELTWGYEDPLFSLVHKLDSSLLPDGNFSLKSRCKVFTNNTIYTGKNDSTLREMYYIWNGFTEISQWGSPTAKMINGSDATFFATSLSRNHNIEAFTDDFQRSAYFEYEKDESVFGVNTFQYKIPKQELNTTLMDPGFYPNSLSGVFNLSAVEPFGTPLFVSKPHFLDADTSFLNNVTGLHPNRTIHDSFINVEPITGTTLKAAKRIQANILLQRNKNFMQLSKLRELTLIPIFYDVESGSATEESAQKLNSALVYVENSIKIGLPVIIGVSCITSMISIVLLVLKVIKRKKVVNNNEVEQNLNEETPLLQ